MTKAFADIHPSASRLLKDLVSLMHKNETKMWVIGLADGSDRWRAFTPTESSEELTMHYEFRPHVMHHPRSLVANGWRLASMPISVMRARAMWDEFDARGWSRIGGVELHRPVVPPIHFDLDPPVIPSHYKILPFNPFKGGWCLLKANVKAVCFLEDSARNGHDAWVIAQKTDISAWVGFYRQRDQDGNVTGFHGILDENSTRLGRIEVSDMLQVLDIDDLRREWTVRMTSEKPFGAFPSIYTLVGEVGRNHPKQPPYWMQVR